MTYNQQSKTMSTRIDPAALDVLEWHARLTGVPLRRWLRQLLEARAEELTEEFNLDLSALPPTPPKVVAATLDAEDELAKVDLDPRKVFVDRLADALDMDTLDVDRLIETAPDGSLSATLDGTTFTNHPTIPVESHP
jgi:hypothetical protein